MDVRAGPEAADTDLEQTANDEFARVLRRAHDDAIVAPVGRRPAFAGVQRLRAAARSGRPERCPPRHWLTCCDDIAPVRDHAHSALPDVLVERHAENRPTWVTTGLTREQLVERYGQGIVARVFERATLIRVGVDAHAERTLK